MTGSRVGETPTVLRGGHALELREAPGKIMLVLEARLIGDLLDRRFGLYEQLTGPLDAPLRVCIENGETGHIIL